MTSTVTFSQGMTVNMGNFESARVDVSFTLDIPEGDDPQDVFESCVSLVETNLREQLASISGDSPKPAPTRRKKTKKRKTGR